MKTTMIRGIPKAVQRDGWWMEQFERPTRKAPPQSSAFLRPLILLALIALGDTMVWKVMPGASLAVFFLAIVAAAMMLAPSLSDRRGLLCLSGAGLSVLPLIELVQPLSVFIAILGTLAVLCGIAGVQTDALWRAMRRYPWAAFITGMGDTMGCLKIAGTFPAPKGDLRGVLMGWALPLCLGGVFLLLLLGANPLLETWLQNMGHFQMPEPDIARILFWSALALPVWSALIAPRLLGRLTAQKPARHTVKRPGLINTQSVTRSLVLFNAMFAVQTGLDFLFLFGDISLPDGMTYAEYAHRGAYPLLVTALMAGGFAILARPFTDDAPALRALLFLWLAQTLCLVAGAALRLDLYVEVYGLTRLRLSAAIWMGVVALGLVLVIWQGMMHKSTRWLMQRCAALGVASLYACAFVNFDGIIAEYNLTHDVQRDDFYLCYWLGEGAVPVLEAHHGTSPNCDNFKGQGQISEPKDWREWGFRNWRLRRSLAALEAERQGH